MLKGISEYLPGIPVIGNTMFTGVIMPEGFVGGENGFVGILTLSDENPAVGIAGLPKAGSARENGKAVAQIPISGTLPARQVEFNCAQNVGQILDAIDNIMRSGLIEPGSSDFIFGFPFLWR